MVRGSPPPGMKENRCLSPTQVAKADNESSLLLVYVLQIWLVEISTKHFTFLGGRWKKSINETLAVCIITITTITLDNGSV